MLKEIKYLIFFIIIFTFIFLLVRFYISDENKKKTFRSLSHLENTIIVNEKNLPILYNDTNNIVEYLNSEKNINKKYLFWNLLEK
tara:strand:+ start:435 stop:689 length:255 start_codon:yes stop_codon:yes gene_type:complete